MIDFLRFYRGLMLLFSLIALPALASNDFQDFNIIKKIVETYTKQQTAALPGQVAVTVGTLDPRMRLPACPHIEPFTPPGGRLWGNSTVGVRCEGPTAWILYVPVTVKVIADVVVAARPLGRGKILDNGDLALQARDITQLPAGILSDPSQGVGRVLISSIASGYPIRMDMLKAPTVIQIGQTVSVIAKGRGFNVHSEGKALSNAVVGQIVQVRTGSGQIVSGVAKEDGTVEVAF